MLVCCMGKGVMHEEKTAGAIAGVGKETCPHRNDAGLAEASHCWAFDARLDFGIVGLVVVAVGHGVKTTCFGLVVGPINGPWVGPTHGLNKKKNNNNMGKTEMQKKKITYNK